MGVRSELDSSPAVVRVSDDDEPLPSKYATTTQLSDVAMAKSQSSQDLWFIHGNGYDLKEFVERHPGGKEAILLGRGRDCTALVESYHPFSNQHWYAHYHHLSFETSTRRINSHITLLFTILLAQESTGKILQDTKQSQGTQARCIL